MLEELGKIERREYVHRYSRENKLEDQAITSPFSEHISHLQIMCSPGGKRSSIWPASYAAAFECSDTNI